MIESNLINAYKSGDNALVAKAYQAYATRMSMVAYRWLNSADDARDVVMDVFEGLLQMDAEKRLVQIPKSPDTFKSWLFLCTKNACLDILRKRQVRYKYQPLLTDDHLVLSVVEKKWDKQIVDYVMNQLVDSEREVVRLHFEGYSNMEIAQLRNLSYQTVRNQLSSAKKIIRKYIKPELYSLILFIILFK